MDEVFVRVINQKQRGPSRLRCFDWHIKKSVHIKILEIPTAVDEYLSAVGIRFSNSSNDVSVYPMNLGQEKEIGW